MRRLRSLVVLWTILLGMTWAEANTSRFHLIGLSEDGKFVACEVYGFEEATGNPYVAITLINTEKNSYAAPTVLVRGEQEVAGRDMVADVRRSAAKQAAAVLQSLHIKPGYTGIGVDPSSHSDTTRSLLTARLAKNLPERQVDLTLRPLAMKAEQKICESDTKGLELMMSTKGDKGNATTTVLQKDTKIPVSRGCPVSYRIDDVVFSEHGHIIVVLSYMDAVPGGPNLEYLVVTGRVK